MSKVSHFLKSFVPKSIFALIAGWLLFLTGLGIQYTNHLLHPDCSPGSKVMDGYQPVLIQTRDGLSLQGWWSPPQNGAVILVAGGSGMNRDDMLKTANLLQKNGYGVLTIDGRNCAGQSVSLGYRESQDVLRMLDFAQSQPGVTWIGALGFSSGGAAVIHAAAEAPEIKGVIAQGNYSNMLYEITNDGASPFSFQWQVNQAVVLVLWVRMGVWPGNISPLEDLALLRQPVFLIHGELEAENNQAQTQFERVIALKDLWLVPTVGHGGYLEAFPQEYETRLMNFLRQAQN